MIEGIERKDTKGLRCGEPTARSRRRGQLARKIPRFLSAPPAIGTPLLSARIHLLPIWSGPMRFPWFSRAIRSPRPRRFQPVVQALEDRSLMSTVWVTPIDTPLDATHYHSLTAAIPAAGTSGA